MTDTSTPSIDDLETAVGAAAPDLAEPDQRVAVAIFRLLARGEPVTATAIAEAAEEALPDVEARLDSWHGVFRDGDGRVVGFWGLALPEMPHRITVNGRPLHTWCAWDPMFLSLIVGPIDVATDDPVTGEEIRYRLDHGRVTDLSHPEAVLSFLHPDQPWDDNVMDSFCHYVVNFAGPDSAAAWTADNPGTFTISLDDGLRIARHHVDTTFGDALD